MTVLVTGGAGFIGSHIVDELIFNNEDVIIADNFSSGKIKNVNKKAKIFNIDILSDEFENIFKENKIDYVIHLAAQISVKKATDDPCEDARLNILGSINVFQLCDKYEVKKIIVSSSAAVYGNPQYLPVDEAHPTNPSSFYGLSKHTMENYVKIFKTDYLILRFANVYGERQSISGESGVITIFNDAMKNNKKIYIDGNGEQTRDFVFVNDIAKICTKLVKSNTKNKIINVSSNTETSINKLFDTMANLLDYKLKPIYREKRIGDIKESVLDNSLLKLIYEDFEPTELDVGLEKCIKVSVK